MIVINTLVFNPIGILKDFVRILAVREFDCLNEELNKPMFAIHEVHMMFTINCRMHEYHHTPSNSQPFMREAKSSTDCVFAGLLTSMKGSMTFRGHVKLLTIQFKPTGFYRIFGISPAEITDYLGHSADLFNVEIHQLHERLHEQDSAAEMFKLVESFLIDKLYKRKLKHEMQSLTRVSEFLMNHPGKYSIDKLASQTNMCLKTFERKFLEHVGLSPKLFERIKRFNDGLELKVYHPELSWSEISHQLGYYDQTHFIKDFSTFTNESPTSCFKNMPPPYEHEQPA
jgi:AraC-like DNA-binding protein